MGINISPIIGRVVHKVPIKGKGFLNLIKVYALISRPRLNIRCRVVVFYIVIIPSVALVQVPGGISVVIIGRIVVELIERCGKNGFPRHLKRVVGKIPKRCIRCEREVYIVFTVAVFVILENVNIAVYSIQQAVFRVAFFITLLRSSSVRICNIYINLLNQIFAERLEEHGIQLIAGCQVLHVCDFLIGEPICKAAEETDYKLIKYIILIIVRKRDAERIFNYGLKISIDIACAQNILKN